MKLFASVVTTTAIAGTVWGVVLMQPTVAHANPQNPTEKSTEQQATYYLHGVSQSLPLENVPQLWEQFYRSNNGSALPASIRQITVLYREINSDFSQATVTIGYPVKNRTESSYTVQLPPVKNAEVLLIKGAHSAEELGAAWLDINFSKDVLAVVETHDLNVHGLPETSQVSIYYK